MLGERPYWIKKLEQRAQAAFPEAPGRFKLIATDGQAVLRHEALDAFTMKLVLIVAGQAYLVAAVTGPSVQFCSDMLEEYISGVRKRRERGIDPDAEVLEDIK